MSKQGHVHRFQGLGLEHVVCVYVFGGGVGAVLGKQTQPVVTTHTAYLVFSLGVIHKQQRASH